jgi:hypothetical protein
MSPTLERRLAQLERQALPSVPDRVVWWEGDPEPKGEPGERLTIVRWLGQDEDLPGASAPGPAAQAQR